MDDYCETCEGDGTVQVVRDGVVVANAVTCPKCKGTGIVTDHE